jgi:prepilin-type N-terminal cleavage/methylation domain-containing protein
MTRPRSAARARAGFTLIEVMAAVFMLGLFVAAISQLLTQAQRNEGAARQRARAAALADRTLAEIEEGIARGAPPALGQRETREGDLIATTEVAALAAEAFTPAAAPAAPGARDAPPGRAAVPPDEPGWLATPAAEQAPPVLDVQVGVTWEGAPRDAETQVPATVRRRSFALNPAALASLESAEDGNPPEGATE